MTLHYRYELQHAVGVHLSWHRTLAGAIEAAHAEAERLGLLEDEESHRDDEWPLILDILTDEVVDYPYPD